MENLYAAGSLVGGVHTHSGNVRGLFHAGPGIWDIILQPDKGIAAANCAIKVQLMSAVPDPITGALGCSFGIVHTNDTDKRITMVREPAGGGASVAADQEFSYSIIKISQ